MLPAIEEGNGPFTGRADDPSEVNDETTLVGEAPHALDLNRALCT
jgi:hypothetical protein